MMYFNVAVAPLMNFSPAAKLLQFTLTLKTLDKKTEVKARGMGKNWRWD